jgi:hypothetical protein
MTSPLLVPTSCKDLFYLPALCFLKCILIVQGCFTSAFQTYTFGSLIRLTVPHYLLFLYHPAPLLFSSIQCVVLYYRHTQMQCFNIFHSLTFSFTWPPIVPQTDPLIQSCSLSLSLYVYMDIHIYRNMYIRLYIYLCVHL